MKKKIMAALIAAAVLSVSPVYAAEPEESQESVKPIDLIQVGMTYEDVVKALGVEGGKISEIAVYSWTYNDGSGYLTVTTQNGVVTAKNEVKTVTETCDITLDIFNSIKMGMTYDEVRDAIGADGTLITDTDLGGVSSKMYMWKAADGIGNATIMFQNDAVVSGSQTGLK